MPDFFLKIAQNYKSRLKRLSMGKKPFLIGILILGVGLYYALSDAPIDSSMINVLWFGVLSFCFVPVIILLNTFELQTLAKIVRKRLIFRKAFLTTILASAANYLPMPGAILVRIGSLTGDGTTVSQSTKVTMLSPMAFAFAVSLYSGLGILIAGYLYIGTLMLIGGLIIGFVFGFFVTKEKYNPKMLIRLVGVRFIFCILESFRLIVAVWAVSSTITFTNSMIISGSSFLGAAVSIVPAGLGVREVFAGGIAEIINLDFSIIFLASIASRISATLTLMCASIYIALFVSPTRTLNDEETADR